jgi:hypothetical protein
MSHFEGSRLARRSPASARLDGVARLCPGVKPSGERSNPPESLVDQQAGHTGRRRLVGSGTVEDDLPVARQLIEHRVEVVDVEHGRALDTPGIALR